MINCARFYFYVGDMEKYDETIEKTNEMNFETGEDLIVKGWKNCYNLEYSQIKEGQKYFQTYIEQFGANNIDALMGGFKCLERMKENEEILDSFQEIGQIFQTFFPLHIEKCKIFLNTNDYDNALDYITSKVTIRHFEIYKIMAICNLIHEGNYQTAFSNLEKMWDLLISQEPKNPELYYNTCRLFSKICERRINFIKKCEQMIDKAIEFVPRNAMYLIEKGYYRLYQNDIDKAFSLFSQASEIDMNNKDSSIGIILCKIIRQKYKEASDDIEFLRDILTSLQQPIHPKLTYYQGVIKLITGEKEDVVGNIISESLNIHVKTARQGVFNKYDILVATDFDFLYEMAKVLILNYNFSQQISLQSIPQNITKAQKILELIIKNKYFTNAQLLYGKLKYLLNEKSQCAGIVQNILQIDPKNVDAFTLFALIKIDMGDFAKAKEIINEAMINNLVQTREHPYFNIAKVRCEIGLNDNENAQKTLNELLKNFDKYEIEERNCKFILLIHYIVNII